MISGWPSRALAKLLVVLPLLALVACAAPVVPPADSGDTLSLAEISDRVRVSARATCREVRSAGPCNLRMLIVEVEDPDEANAFLIEDRLGRPTILLTPALIVETRNADELAFVLSHEAAHHILGHLDQARQDAAFGAEIFGRLAEAEGLEPKVVKEARAVGAFIGRRSYSQDYELEADALGALIAQQAGFDALRGARFFTRIPDPDDAFLSSHPPNATRIEAVQEALTEGS